MKALGVKPPERRTTSELVGRLVTRNIGNLAAKQRDHYRQALIEAAEELDDHHCMISDSNRCVSCKLARKLRISAGVKEE